MDVFVLKFLVQASRRIGLSHSKSMIPLPGVQTFILNQAQFLVYTDHRHHQPLTLSICRRHMALEHITLNLQVISGSTAKEMPYLTSVPDEKGKQVWQV